MATSKSLLRVSEHIEAVKTANYLLFLQRQHKIQLYTHVPHETYTPSFNQRRKNAQEGVRKGIPDYIIVTGTEVIFLELKATDGRASPEQKEWLLALTGKTTVAYLAKGFEEAKKQIDSHIKNPPQ